MKEIRVRIAPSPTGNFHVGTARNSLYNYIFARKNNGKFILRIDDTDMRRNSEESEKGIYEGLKWLGLDWDEGPDVGGPYGPYRQSERIEIYQKYIDYLIDKGDAYYCFCTEEELEMERKEQIAKKQPPKYSGKCRNLTMEEIDRKLKSGLKPTVRFKVPNKIISFNDGVRGELKWDGNLIGDFVIRKSDGLPTYNFATAIDDWKMKISHVLRSQEHIPNTFLQILILEALDAEIPQYVHLPLLLNEDRSKISKRDGALYIGEYKEMGYLKEAVLNFIALLGWNPGDGEEILSIEDMINKFSFDRINNSNVVFDFKKLEWFNGIYIRRKDIKELVDLSVPFLMETDYFKMNEENYKKLFSIMRVEQERIKRLDEVKEAFKMFFVEPSEYDINLIKENVKKIEVKDMVFLLEKTIEELKMEDNWHAEELEKRMRDFCDRIGTKTKILFMLLRIAETGSKVSPPLFDTFEIIGKDSTIRRLTNCKKYLETIE
ncbi:glutamate--tRNA ligase [Caloramator australicus]|uniref:Glutamate--tRNA ligase n=1 Tax=Caloramator australicus RC3 TaxID=857293 RepID=I7LIA0_9CLOT|nr:glutamate--tRNA ligase [Caloramator australicus]CCJ32782.1 Glutamyl-tRNA synthetase @ Glutamyl-tRNA(Gln) synthetase \